MCVTILKNVALRGCMSEIYRFGISLPKDLLDKFDKLIQKRKYSNRSEAFRDLIRQELITKEWQQGKEIAGAIILVYDHHRRELVHKLMEIQHDYQNLIISTQHIHLDHNNCMEIMALKGKPREAQELADTLRAVKGVKHGTLNMSSTGKEMG